MQDRARLASRALSRSFQILANLLLRTEQVSSHPLLLLLFLLSSLELSYTKVTLKPRIKLYKPKIKLYKMSLKYEPASEPLHIYVKTEPLHISGRSRDRFRSPPTSSSAQSRFPPTASERTGNT